jgi:hypothetical protein
MSNSTMRRITIAEFHAELKAQGVSSNDDIAFKCPMCGTIQSGRDLIATGAGTNFDDVEKYVGFSCVGRFTDAPAPRAEPDGKPCNWTLGGLFKLHKLEVIDADGRAHPRFELATPEEAQSHVAKTQARLGELAAIARMELDGVVEAAGGANG